MCLTRVDGRMPDEPLTFDNPETLIMFPVCPRLLAMGFVNKMTELHEADRRVVRLANKTLMQYCDQRVIAPHEQFEVGRNRFAVGAGILEIVAGRVNF